MVTRKAVCTIGSGEREHRRGCQCSTRKKRLSIQYSGSYGCQGATTEVTHLPRPPVQLSKTDWFFHDGCACNHINALENRVGACIPYPSRGGITTLRQRAIELSKVVGVHPQSTLESVIQGFHGKRRARYEKARADYLRGGVNKRHARTTMFVKLEGIKYSTKKVNPSCRAIQFRAPVYTLLAASYFKPIEHHLYQVAGGAGFPTTRFIAKNMRPDQRAASMLEKFESLPGCEVLELDASRFDAHVSKELLEIEHLFWKRCNSDPQFAELLSWQLVNKGSAYTKQGRIRYSVQGGRMSGDANTAAGNCVLMSCMLSAFGLSLGAKFDFLCDGDDSVFFYQGPRVKEQDVVDFFLQFGMTMKIENRTTEFRNINFCQGKPCRIGGKWTLVRDPSKILSKTTINPKFGIVSLRPKLLKTIAQAELSLNRGVPVLQEYLLSLRRVAEKHMSNRGLRDGGLLRAGWTDYRLRRDLPFDWTEQEASPVTSQARQDFSVAWGVSVAEQLSLEESFKTWEFDLMSTGVTGDGLDVSRWLYGWQHQED